MVRSPLIVPAPKTHTATVICAHGLGDTGEGWSFLAQMLGRSKAFEEVSWVFPHAARIPITMNMGMSMPGWFDIKTLDDTKVSQEEDETGIGRSREVLHGLINDEIKKGISANRIVLGGFSQGGAMALQAGLSFPQQLGGVFGLSSFLLLREKFMSLLPEGNPNAGTKVFMGHGTADPLVLYSWGTRTADFLKANGFDVTLHSYDGVVHTASEEELADLAKWLQERLPAVGDRPKPTAGL